MVRSVGLIIAVIAVGGFIVYIFFNWLAGRNEIGAEIHTPPNRKPGDPDEKLETKRLDIGLATGLFTLIIIGIALPLYWLGEPGRQEGRVAFDDKTAVEEGRHLYEERCASCHGTVSGSGGNIDHVLLDNDNTYLATVSWQVPSLSTVLYRFSESEVKYVLDYGRPNTPMAAWGAPGGGPFITQQIDNILAYLADEQVMPAELRDRVGAGLISTAREKALTDSPQLVNNRDALQVATEQILLEAETNKILYGELLFNNIGDSGVYGCARCHTPGWSYKANKYVERTGGLIGPEISGGGAFGPSLRNGSTIRQFDTAIEQENFITVGSMNGIRYGNFGQGDGGGQMPSFGVCAGDRDAGDRDRIKRHNFCLTHNSGLLTSEQLSAIVAYERSSILNPSRDK